MGDPCCRVACSGYFFLEPDVTEKPDLYGMDEDQMQALIKVMAVAETAFNDWMNTCYLNDGIDGERVRESSERIAANGGTLSYIAQVLQRIRMVKKWLES
jgi:hypothetical protein